jgi:rhomboid-related protein 1/2/3
MTMRFQSSVQFLIGLPLEIVHGPLAIGLVYLSGVLTGALVTTLTDPASYLLGASGGVYALIAAHLPTLVMNWREMRTFLEWMVW